ncbi:uncharacterized protein LOC142977275 [Anticarsia gemmatalis]|uniref:uncharacterized protein LOC142977275 n=1 Tax=Anticarsia gemmatalis TaxID=129554 RepID=UPI003F75AB21
MFGLKLFYFVALMVCLGTTNVRAALSIEDRMAMKEAAYPFIVECIEEMDISKEKLVEMLKKGSNADYDPCFVSCVFKKAGFFDDKGMYDVENTMAFTKRFVKDEENLNKIDKVRRECAKVNDDEVSDGDKGCERAKMLFDCFQSHKNEINIDE